MDSSQGIQYYGSLSACHYGQFLSYVSQKLRLQNKEDVNDVNQ